MLFITESSRESTNPVPEVAQNWDFDVNSCRSATEQCSVYTKLVDVVIQNQSSYNRTINKQSKMPADRTINEEFHSENLLIL